MKWLQAAAIDAITRLIRAISDISTPIQVIVILSIVAFIIFIISAYRGNNWIRGLAISMASLVLFFFVYPIIKPPPPTPKTAILWVDQEPENDADTYGYLMNLKIYEIKFVSSGEAALVWLRAHPEYTIVISRVDCLPATDNAPTCKVPKDHRAPDENYAEGLKLVADLARPPNRYHVIIYDAWFATSHFCINGRYLFNRYSQVGLPCLNHRDELTDVLGNLRNLGVQNSA